MMNFLAERFVQIRHGVLGKPEKGQFGQVRTELI